MKIPNIKSILYVFEVPELVNQLSFITFFRNVMIVSSIRMIYRFLRWLNSNLMSKSEYCQLNTQKNNKFTEILINKYVQCF